MAHPIGLPSEELADGTWVGMTPEGIQRVIGSQYTSSGILPGNRTVTKVKGTSGWAYQVPALTAFMWISYASRRGVLVPVEAETIPVSAPVGGASRTDVIYIDMSGTVKVAEGATKAPAGVEIDRMVIPAGAKNTQGAVSNWDTQYAIPAGASLGRLGYWRDPGGGAASMNETVRYAGRFVVPSDRLIRVDLMSTLRSAVSTKPGRCEIVVRIDGTWTRAVAAHHDGEWRTYSGSWSTGVLEGSHTIEVLTKGYGTGTWQFNSDGKFPTEFSLWDMGVDD